MAGVYVRSFVLSAPHKAVQDLESDVMVGQIVCVAAGVSFYYAKKQMDSRRREQHKKGTRPTEKLERGSFRLLPTTVPCHRFGI